MLDGMPMLCPLCNKDVKMQMTEFKQQMEEDGLVQTMKAQFSCGHTSESLTKYPTVMKVEPRDRICNHDGKKCHFSHDCEFCHVHHRSGE